MIVGSLRKDLSILIVSILTAGLLCACGSISVNVSIPAEASDEAVSCGETAVSRNDEFGHVVIGMSVEEFEAKGFSFGDSVDIEFNNGVTFRDIPYYSGYFGQIGDLVVCAYPGYEKPVIARVYGDPTWEEFGLDDSSAVVITMNKKGHYLVTQQLNEIVYSDIRDDYASDAEFANFREIEGGSVADDMFYRSASPCNDQYNRASCIDDMIEEYNIGYVLNLADTDEKYEDYREETGFDSGYYDMLYNKGCVLMVSLNSNYRSDVYAGKIADAFLKVSGQNEPVLIHCLEGKDRTGFAAALLLALADATPQEIIDDYMITYDNYYGINSESDPVKYDVILDNVRGFLCYMCDAPDEKDITGLDIKSGAENYLRKGGLDDAQITQIENFISKGTSISSN